MDALGPMPCIGCGKPVFWEIGGKAPLLMEHAGRLIRHHACRGVCGAWMPNARERCARRAGHGGTVRYPDHRTRYALDNAAFSRRQGWAA
jgi:hypothetical protein